MAVADDLLGGFETHSPDVIREALNAGVDPIAPIRGKAPIYWLIEMYTRSPRFAGCLRLMLDAGASLDTRLNALPWGAACDWETVLFDVTPISYAQCGLYPQFHRREQDVYANIAYLHQRRHGKGIQVRNISNKYVDEDFDLFAARGGQAPEPTDEVG